VDDARARYRALFDACYAPLVAYARRRTRSYDEADDVVADVFAVAWRRLDDVPTGAELQWLYGVAYRTLANARRSTTRRLRLLERLRNEPTATFPSDSDDVLIALASLRRSDQEILRLAAWEQLQPAEMAVVLGITANAATLRLSRARAHLRAALTGSPGRRTQAQQKVTDA
jgi:RNA polymerase sigma-70 factor (ECF subfamily)